MGEAIEGRAAEGQAMLLCCASRTRGTRKGGKKERMIVEASHLTK